MKDYCELEECLALKELGFKERVSHFFDTDEPKIYCSNELGWDFNTSFLEFCSRPSYDKAFEFFEKEFDLYIEIGVDKTSEPKFCFNVYRFVKESLEWGCILFWSSLYYTRSEAKKECLKYLIKIVRDENSSRRID